MPISFPPSPSVDDIYTYNGAKYIWDGVKWVSGGQNAYIVQGEDAVLGATQVASLNGGQLAGLRNKIINGAMQVAQRAVQETGVTIDGYYTCDRFFLNINNLGTWTVEQSTDAPAGFANSLKITCTTPDAVPATNERIWLDQNIEGYNLQDLQFGSSGAKALTVSFWVKSNKTGAASLNLFQTDNTNKQYSTSYTINASNTWEYKTITVPGDTAGNIDSDNGLGLQLEWVLNSGSTYTGGSGSSSWGSFNNANRNFANLGIGGAVSDYFAITGVQLEASPVATPFEQRPIATELALCQRYYQDTGAFSNYPLCRLNDPAAGAAYSWWTFVSSMRMAPSVAYNSGTWVSGSRFAGDPGFDAITKYGVRVGSTTTVSPNGILYLNGPGFNMDAEL
jgi:hypothetical protein